MLICYGDVGRKAGGCKFKLLSYVRERRMQMKKNRNEDMLSGTIDITQALRWIARIVGVLVGATLGPLVIGTMFQYGFGAFSQFTWQGLFDGAVWGGLFVGLVLAFFWEGIGGGLLTLSALAIQINILMQPNGTLNPYILVPVLDGLTFLYCWWRTHRHSSAAP
jgi:hypothetical protein